MKVRWFHTVSMAGLLAAVAVSAQAQDDYALKASGTNPLYPAVSAEATFVGKVAPAAEETHGLNAEETNPFYAGINRAESVTFTGGVAPMVGDPSLKAADVNPLY
ncbi:MAG: hypothetical protein ACOYXR_12860 [Nitrospirota bacterium]